MLIKKIVKKGTSNYILIPNDIMLMLNLKLGDKVQLSVINNKIIVDKVVDNSVDK